MRNDPSRAFGVSAFIPSEIKQLDVLIEHLEERTPGTHLLPIFDELDSILGSLYSIYLNELQFLADGEPQNAAANQIAKDFHAVRPLLSDLRGELNLQNSDSALPVANELKEAVKQLFLSFGDLKRQAATGPQYSQLPFTQELLRVVHHYLKGRLPMSAVQERLDAFCNYHDNLELSFEHMVPTSAEAPVLEERQEDLEEALALQLQGIEDLDLALERRSDRGVEKAVEALTVSAEALYDIYQELENAQHAVATVTCFRCGANNGTESRLCSGCGAQLPRFDSNQEKSTLEFHEGGSSSQSVPEELLRLQSAVQQAISGQDSGVLDTPLDSFASRLNTLKSRMAAMKAPPTDIPAEHLQLLNEGKELFQESLETLSQGYELLREGSDKLDAHRLRRGLEEIEAGFVLMQEFRQTFEQAEQLSPRAAGSVGQ